MNTFTSAPLWYSTRSAGTVSFVLLTVTMLLGIATSMPRFASPRLPRFASQALHRNCSLLAVAFLGLHIATTVADSYVSVSATSAVVPLTSGYLRWQVALGTLAVDLLLLVVASSLLRPRVPQRVWRVLHWSSYGLWPLALGHALTSGTDAIHGGWMFYLGIASLLAVLSAAGLRLADRLRPRPDRPLASVAAQRTT